MSSLLFDKDDILLVNRRLAAIVGLNEAIVLQQIDYWVKKKRGGVEHQGCRWVFNSLDSWHAQFPFWSKDTVKRALAALKARGLIRVQKLAEAARDQTNYYTVDYKAVTLLEASNLHPSIGANCTDGEGQDAPMGKGNLHQSEGADCTDANRTKTTTKTTFSGTAGAAPAAIKKANAGAKKTAKKPAKKNSQPTGSNLAAGAIDDVEAALQDACRATWTAYSAAYEQRYKVKPVRNAPVNANVKALVKRLGYEEAPQVAEWYVANVHEPFVVNNSHGVGVLVNQAEGYRTQWARAMSGASQDDQQAPVETYAQRAARQRVEEVTPLAARKVPGAPNPIERLSALMQSGLVKIGTEVGPVAGEGDDYAPR